VVWLAVSGGAHRVFQVDYKSPTTFITINSIIFIITIIIIIIIIIIIMKSSSDRDNKFYEKLVSQFSYIVIRQIVYSNNYGGKSRSLCLGYHFTLWSWSTVLVGWQRGSRDRSSMISTAPSSQPFSRSLVI
jgi:glucan phosphoethanolaminetransferase (alkaline phosphatase superfamily)